MPQAAIVLAAAAAVGGTIGAIGQLKAARDKEKAERENYDFFKRQQSFIEEAGLREQDVFYKRSQQVLAAQTAGYAKAGVEMSGSPLFMAEQNFLTRQRELQVMRENTAERSYMAGRRAEQSAKDAALYGSTGYQFLTVAPTLLGAGTAAYSAFQRNKDTGDTYSYASPSTTGGSVGGGAGAAATRSK